MKRLCLIIGIVAVLIAAPVFALEPGIFDIVIYGGEDYRLNLAFKDSAGSAINLTGHTIKAQARKAYADTAAFATFSSSITNASQGKIAIWLTKRATASLTGQSGYYDIRDTAPDSSISYPVKGAIKIMPTVTR